MPNKSLTVNLTPQNEEWISLIPNQTQNLDIFFNKLIDFSISDGLFLEVISQSLTVADLSKFKTAYSRIQAKRAVHMAELETTPLYVDKRKTNDSLTEEDEIIQEESSVVPPKKQEKKLTHGFSETEF